MAKRTRKQLIIDDLAKVLRKPCSGPLIAPSEAIAIGLSMVQPGPGELVSPDGPLVRQALLALHLAG